MAPSATASLTSFWKRGPGRAYRSRPLPHLCSLCPSTTRFCMRIPFPLVTLIPCGLRVSLSAFPICRLLDRFGVCLAAGLLPSLPAALVVSFSFSSSLCSFSASSLSYCCSSLVSRCSWSSSISPSCQCLVNAWVACRSLSSAIASSMSSSHSYSPASPGCGFACPFGSSSFVTTSLSSSSSSLSSISCM